VIVEGSAGEILADSEPVGDDLIGHLAEEFRTDDDEGGAERGENNGGDNGEAKRFEFGKEAAEAGLEVLGFVEVGAAWAAWADTGAAAFTAWRHGPPFWYGFLF